MSNAIVTVGISASGKTTFAEGLCKKDRSWINVNRDDIRFSLTGACGWKEYKFNKSIENMVTELQKSTCALAYKQGKNVVLSDTNLNSKTRKMWDEYLTRLGFEIEYKDFPIDVQEAIKRDAQRANGVGYEVIHKQWQQWLGYIDFKRYVPDESLVEAIIVDADGTIASMEGIRKPYEWDKVHLDRRIDVVADMIDGFARLDYKIIVMSGRDGSCYDATKKWLTENLYWFDELHMRTAGDNRKDSIIKQELFWENVANKYNVKAVVDDRKQMIRAWTDLGLKVINVGNYYEEF
jgi:predicted kinase